MRELSTLRSVVAAYVVEAFEVPRPRALLGQANLDRLVDSAARIVHSQTEAFATLRVSAAGADSAVMARLKAELAARLRLEASESGGDLLLALRRSSSGWEVLLRTTPRPLSARAWRVCDLPGALNAIAAHVLATLSQPRADETFVNIGCGSGTLLIERLALAPVARMIGYDIDPTAIACARRNVEASGFAASVELAACDATHMPLAPESVRTVVADLPFAMRMGTGRANAELYPALLAEARRVLTSDGRVVVVTTQHRLMARIIVEWDVETSVPFQLSHAGGTFYATIYVLRPRKR
jgi:tRNA (guanine6-N2)-methyltransferase